MSVRLVGGEPPAFVRALRARQPRLLAFRRSIVADTKARTSESKWGSGGASLATLVPLENLRAGLEPDDLFQERPAITARRYGFDDHGDVIVAVSASEGRVLEEWCRIERDLSVRYIYGGLQGQPTHVSVEAVERADGEVIAFAAFVDDAHWRVERYDYGASGHLDKVHVLARHELAPVPDRRVEELEWSDDGKLRAINERGNLWPGDHSRREFAT